MSWKYQYDIVKSVPPPERSIRVRYRTSPRPRWRGEPAERIPGVTLEPLRRRSLRCGLQVEAKGRSRDLDFLQPAIAELELPSMNRSWHDALDTAPRCRTAGGGGGARGFFRRLRENSRRAARRSPASCGRRSRHARRRDLGAAGGGADLRRRRRAHDGEGGRAPRAEAEEGGIASGEDLGRRLQRNACDLARSGEDRIDVSHSPSVILTVGVNGTGKTTTIGKIAWHLRKELGSRW